MHGPLTLNMPLEDAMATQRAIRRLTTDPVDDALVLHLIELALNPAVKARLARLNRRAWNIYGGLGRRMMERRGDRRMLKILDAVQWQADHFEEIPVIVVACLRGLIPIWPPVATASAYGSIFPSVQNLLLAARAAGLGAALITLPLWSKWLARRALGLPWTISPCAVIPLGWPRGRYGPTTRRPVEDVVSLDRYGNRAFAPRSA
jgi:nitroreductase